MSLYLGKNASGNSILHMTQGTHSISTLQEPVISATSFHSSMPYLEVLTYSLDFAANKGGGFYPSVVWLKLPIAVRDLLVSQPNTMIFFSYNGIVQKGPASEGFAIIDDDTGYEQRWWNNAYDYANYTSSVKSTDYPTNANYYTPCHIKGVPYSTLQTAYKLHIVRNIANGVYIPFVPLNNIIQISNSTFSVRGKNILTTVFIQSSKINLVDDCLSADGSGVLGSNVLQLTGSKATGALGISSSAGVSSITRGGNVLFSTQNLSKCKYNSVSTAVNITGSATSESGPLTRTTTLASGMVVGELFTLVTSKTFLSSTSIATSTNMSSAIHQFRVGEIGLAVAFSVEGENVYTGGYVFITLFGYLVGSSTGTLSIRHVVSIEYGSNSGDGSIGSISYNIPIKVMKFT